MQAQYVSISRPFPIAVTDMDDDFCAAALSDLASLKFEEVTFVHLYKNIVP